MEQSRLMGPGYFYKIVFNRKEDPCMIHNSTVMFFSHDSAYYFCSFGSHCFDAHHQLFYSIR